MRLMNYEKAIKAISSFSTVGWPVYYKVTNNVADEDKFCCVGGRVLEFVLIS